MVMKAQERIREDYPGWYSEAMSKEDATGAIYRACGHSNCYVLTF